MTISQVQNWQAVKGMLQRITVEPAMVLFVFSGGLTAPVIMAFIYKKTCIERFANETFICDNLHNKTFKMEEDLVQGDTSHWILWQTNINTALCMLMVLVVGSVGDLYSRKLSICIPLVMSALQISIYIVLSIDAIFLKFPVQLFILPPILVGLGSSWAGFFSQTLGYVASVSSTETRTERIAWAQGMFNVGTIISSAIWGVLLDNTSFIFVFSLACGLYILAAFYTVIRVKDIDENADTHGVERKSIIDHVLSIYKDALKVVFQKRTKHRRCHILIVLLLTAIITLGTARKFHDRDL